VYARNSAGNLADVTSDTHDIRSSLLAFDKLYPGKIPRGWFVDDKTYKAYRKTGAFNPVEDERVQPDECQSASRVSVLGVHPAARYDEQAYRCSMEVAGPRDRV
jgi:hypothetical protein